VAITLLDVIGAVYRSSQLVSVFYLTLAAILGCGCSSMSVNAASVSYTETLQEFTPSLTLSPTSIPTETQTPTARVEFTQTPVFPGLSTRMVVPPTPVSPDGATPVPTDETGLPVAHYVYGLWGHKQYFKLGCEAAATIAWANYFGVEINEFEFQYRLPISDNPEEGFVGNVNSKWGQTPPFAYGVHAKPVAQLLQEYGVNATAVKNYPLEKLKQQIAADRPVVVWVIGNMVGGIPAEYTAKDGQKTIVAAFEHAVVITGYNKKNIRYLNNDKFFDVPTEVFTNSWKVLGNMALIAGN
jgi:uncharacterized protein YvpB